MFLKTILRYFLSDASVLINNIKYAAKGTRAVGWSPLVLNKF